MTILGVATSVIFNMMSGIVLLIGPDNVSSTDIYSPRWFLETYENYSLLGYLSMILMVLATAVIGLLGNYRIWDYGTTYGLVGLAA